MGILATLCGEYPAYPSNGYSKTIQWYNGYTGQTQRGIPCVQIKLVPDKIKTLSILAMLCGEYPSNRYSTTEWYNGYSRVAPSVYTQRVVPVALGYVIPT